MKPMADIFTDKFSFLPFMKPEDYPKITKYRLVVGSPDDRTTWFLQFKSNFYFLGIRTFISVWRFVPRIENIRCKSESNCSFRGFLYTNDYICFSDYNKTEEAILFTQKYRDIATYFKYKKDIDGPIYL